MSASRYPLAMARDRLVPDFLGRLGRFQTPTIAIIATGVLMVVSGILISVVLIGYMGWIAVLFTVGVIAICLAWYYRYARYRVERDGAIYHWFARLAKAPYEGLDREFREIMKEKGLRSDDPFDEVVARAQFLEATDSDDFEDIVRQASGLLSERLGILAARLEEGFSQGTRFGSTPVSHGAALPHLHIPGIDRPEIVLARSKKGLDMDVFDGFGDEYAADGPVHAIFLLVSPEEDHGQHLRMLAQLASRIDEESFVAHWLQALNSAHLKELLLRDARYITLRIRSIDSTSDLIGKPLKDLAWPDGSLVALIRRDDRTIVPRGSTVLKEGDRITVLGEPPVLTTLRRRYPEA